MAASGGSIGSIITSHVWPVGMAHLGSGVYFIFMAVNLVCAPVVWLLYPETAGRALEDMDSLFGKAGTYMYTAVPSSDEERVPGRDSARSREERDAQDELQVLSDEATEEARFLG